jgi:glycosidase
MSLVDHAIWWHVYPLGATGAPIRGVPDAAHRLSRLESWLDYAVELGCSGLLLGPVFRSTSHGYDTLDHFAIDPRLGTEEDFDHLVAAARDRGVAILLDGVFNHVGAQHPMVSDSGSPIRRIDGRPVGWEGHDDLVLLDHTDPRTADMVVDCMVHWLRRGIAGWRLDVAYAVPNWFWRTVTDRVRQEFPEAVFVGEVIHGDYARIADEGGLDSVTAYELWKATWSSIAERNFWELAWALERHDHFSEGHVLQTFVGNHDVSRIASVVGDAGAVLAVAALMTTPGMPSIYYGDEQAFRGDKGSGEWADDPLRPELPMTPGDLASDGWWLYRVHQDLIGLRRRHPWLTRGRVRVVAKDLTYITYETSGDGHTMRVELGLEPVPSVRISVDGSDAYGWARSSQ